VVKLPKEKQIKMDKLRHKIFGKSFFCYSSVSRKKPDYKTLLANDSKHSIGKRFHKILLDPKIFKEQKKICGKSKFF
jgi:hypothetical protein